MEEKVFFNSDGLKIAGLVDAPSDYKAGERRPAFIMLHGFGGNKDGQGQKVVAKQMAKWGYVSMRVDFRGCGESEGEHGRIICLDQVADTRNAISYLATRPEVDPNRIALIGSSFGAAVAVFTGGADSRVAAVISCGGWGDGERKFRGQHPARRTGLSSPICSKRANAIASRPANRLMVPRYDIVPIPEKLRNRMSHGSIMEFPAETAQSMNDFRADDQVGNISPRPLLLIHSANDSVTPTYESIEMFKNARQPAELHLLSDVDHFTFNEENPRLTNIVTEWLTNISRWTENETLPRVKHLEQSSPNPSSPSGRGKSGYQARAQIEHQQLLKFASNFFPAGGMPRDDAALVAELLVKAELRGYPGHGVTRVNPYLLVKAGTCRSTKRPSFERRKNHRRDQRQPLHRPSGRSS